jgi:L-fuconolactonase
MTPHVLDAHVHLLDPAHLTYPWLPGGDTLQRPWHAAHYAADAPDVAAAIVVEAGVAPGHAAREIAWLHAQAAAHPWIRGIIAHAQVEQPAALEAVLAAYRHDALVVGVRRNLQDEPPGFLRNPALHDGIRRLGQAGLPFDACVRSWQLAELGDLAAACPDTVIVLDHLGKPRCGGDLSGWHTALNALAARPNVRCKLSGLATEAAPGSGPGDLLAAIGDALDAFGPDRCMYGGDWPICTQATGNQAWLDLVRTALDGMDINARGDVLAGTAQRTYRLSQLPPAAPIGETST